MRRPPSRLPSVLASLGKTSSVISDRESATLRGGSKGSTDSIGFSVDNCVRECKSQAEMRAWRTKLTVTRLTVKGSYGQNCDAYTNPGAKPGGCVCPLWVSHGACQPGPDRARPDRV